MQIQSPDIIKKPKQHFVYTACDADYFQKFARPLVYSIARHTDFAIHFHLFNPRDETLEFCENHDVVTYSYEIIAKEQFATATVKWNDHLDEVKRKNLERTINAMNKGRDHDLQHRMQKTYYACVRFLRLAEIFDNRYQTFAMDVDSVVKSSLVSPGSGHDLWIHRIHGHRARYLAGGIWLNACSGNREFLQDYADHISDYFQKDYVYWGIDQDVLEYVAPRYNPGQLPRSFIDWTMRDGSAVWTAKGALKDSLTFKREISKYL